MKERQRRNQSKVQKLKKTSWLFMVGLLFVFILAGCGQSGSFSPSTGSAEAKIVDVFAEKGLEVTNITDTGELSYSGDPEVSVTANSDLDDDGLKKIFKEGYGAGALGMAVFTSFEGENGDVLWVNEIVINDVKYTREGFTFQPDYLSEEFNFKNILADGKMFLEDETYQDYLAQQKDEEEETEQAGTNSGPSAYDICYYVYERYDYYDRQNGEYTADDYDQEVFEDAAEKFGISVDEVHAAWNNYDINRLARQQFYNTHTQQ